jgi:MFS family permease
VVIGLLVFTLFNSSDVFLLVRAKEVVMGDTMVMGIYIFYNLTYALSAYPLGMFADKIGLKTVFIVGLFFFAAVYAGMAVVTDPSHFIGLFFLCGLYAAATEGVAKAWITTLSNKEEMATAIGTFSGMHSICALLASSLTGIIWFSLGARMAFSIAGFATLVVGVYFYRLPRPVGPNGAA